VKIQKCNGCGRILDAEKDDYYSVGELSKHVHGSKMTRMSLSVNDAGEPTNKTEEIDSWLQYQDIDLCETCWEQTDLADLLPKGDM
jgi:hypothetical protein